MAKPITRKATIDSINKFLQTAQEEDAGIPDLEEGEGEPTEEVEGEPGEEVEEDEELEGEPPEDLEERVEELEENQEVIEEAVEEQKEVLEDMLEGGEGGETTFEDFMEDVDEEEEDEEITPDEMGLDEEFLTARNKGKESAMSLREQRKARLSGKKNAAEKTETLSDQWDLDKAKKQRSGPFQPEVTQGKVPEHKLPDMFKVGDLSLEQTPDKKAWIVLDKNDKPFCAIKQGKVADKVFASPEFAKAVILDMHKMGIKQALKKYKAESYVAKKPEKVADSKKTAETNNDYKRRLLRAVRLALNAMHKNLTKEIPLKAAFYEIMSDLEVPQAEKIIETAFAKAGTKHFEVALASAEKFMAMDDAAFVEYESTINDTEVANVTASLAEEPELHEHAKELRRRAREGSLPFSTTSEEDLTDRMVALVNAMPKPRNYNLASYFGKK
jgi:hypothetical protein